MRSNSTTSCRRAARRLPWAAALGAICFVAQACQLEETSPPPAPDAAAAEAAARSDDAGARAAFLAAYPVFAHPRCVNCHPAGDAPLQGDDGRPHAQNVKRGPDGKGLYALKCANCHQETNLPGENMPPGNPSWHLPPAAMPMVFEGRSPGELARQLKDPSQNGGKSLEALVHHVAADALVVGCWSPGDGRSPPPVSHAEFVRSVRDWVEKGAAAPE
jgi:hypothetical protein